MRTMLRSCFVLALALSCWTGSMVHGQAPKVEYVDVQPPFDTKKTNSVLQYISGKANDPAAAADLKPYVRSVLSRLTEKYAQGKIPKFSVVRTEVAGWFSSNTQTDEIRAKVAAEVNSVLIGYIANQGGVYAPAHRINSVYILAELDEARNAKEGTRTPFGPATGNLVKVLNSDRIEKFVKVAALAAIERHVRDGWKKWSAGTKDAVRKSVLAFAVQKPADDMERGVNTWMTRRALDILRTMEANDALDPALGYLADAKEFPSLRQSSLDYLQALDPAKFDANQKKLYVLATIHYLRFQLVEWYQMETDKSKRKSAGGGMEGGGGMGGMGGGMGPGGMGGMGGGEEGNMGPGGMGGMGGGEEGGMGGMGGMGSGGMGGMGGNNRGPRNRLIETQDWETRIARRRLNEVSQSVHRALDGLRVAGETGNQISKIHLTKPDVTFDVDFKLSKLVTLVDDLQKAINDPSRVTTVASLMTITKKPIEEIMLFAGKTPGFLEKYPELKGDDEELEDAKEVKDEGKKDEGKKDDGKKEDGAGEGAVGGAGN